MKLKIKVLAVTLVMVVVASVLLYAPITVALNSGEGQECCGKALNNENFVACGRRRPWLKARLCWWFLNHSEPVEVEGTAVALLKDMLILDTAEGQIRIHLPQEWIVDQELTMREELFESGYLSGDESVNIKALRADVIDKEGLCIYLLLGYEIINDSNIHAYAVLPFNIET
ncbi:hypothetical protein KAU85_04100 [Candidatus Bathyarchaeota archaeon]|nr:hypothetical protein [Candidatus Bathyarchaeota archaeon]